MAEAQDHDFQEIVESQDSPESSHLVLNDLRNVPLRITASLGQTPMYVRDVLDLKKGSIIPLDKMAGELTDLFVNGLHLARGEVVVIGDSLHVRISEIVNVGDDHEDKPLLES